MDLEVGLRAKGNGSTLFCKEDLRNIDFGTEYTHKNVPRQFFLENRGRKQMKIIWVRQKKLEKKPKGEEKQEESARGKNKTPSKPSITLPGQEEAKVEEQFVFTIVPSEITLNPRMGIMVEFRANSFQVGKISEPWQCQVVIGSDRKPKPVFNSNIFGNFITPSLQFN